MASKEERLGFRVDEATKRLIQRAADLQQRKVTDFCIATLVAAARETIAQHEALFLSDRDRQAFFEALVHPPAPNPRLERAFAAERKRVKR